MSIIEKLKSIVTGETNDDTANETFKRVIDETIKEIEKKDKHGYYYSPDVNETSIYKGEVKKWDDTQKINFLQYCMSTIAEYKRGLRHGGTYSHKEEETCNAYLHQILRTKIHFEAQQAIDLINKFCETAKYNSWKSVHAWPIGLFVNQLSKQLKSKIISEELLKALDVLKAKCKQDTNNYNATAKAKLINKLDSIYFDSTNGAAEIKPILFLGDDQFKEFANSFIKEAPEKDQPHWYRLVALAQTANTGKPTKKYLKESNALFKELGAEKFKKTVNAWLVFLYELKEKTTEYTQTYAGGSYNYTTSEFLSSVNSDAIKGFIWMCSHFHDETTLNNISRLAERSYRKIPGKGPAAAAVGNACLFTLFQSKGLSGIGKLSRLKLRIKQANTQKMIDKYLKDAAKTRGISIQEIEDMAVEDFGLAQGKKLMTFDDYQAEIEITGIGKSTLKWIKPDGAYQKSVPAFVKEKHAQKLKKLKATKKQLEQTLTAQRDRVDRMFRQNRSWNMENFTQLYLEHGLMAALSHKLIWVFTSGENAQTGIYIGGKWTSPKGEIFQPSTDSVVTLWHPANYSVEKIKDWRDFLIEKKLQQPLKQAFREVYLLTDAEVNTKSYSNRMAAHVLKQHQFNMLAKTRGWNYALMGWYDDGRYNEAADLELPEFGLKAEYWINEINADDAYNDTGIWNYIATDQIRFLDLKTNDVVDMVDIPVVPFSEVLRDVDLFVGVASVGNDPTWQDSGGVPAYRDYWTAYSFGDLSEIAKNRKEILSSLLPRLKISKVAEIKDKFLVVKGKLRTYKIHIGSTNILMEPNDQYLCIVPDRSKKNHTDNLYIPFEGDSGLSVILSKAFLLAEDDKITDSTITSQIKWR
ncbi:DUF4132 domain-containing protein [Flammeovirgaceae bacterium SG7u.111]|nr:DUF4132 domain-containing protein [Flammeovirgaceae bacterium SG7u.132]WPO36660.1 DUF4132 domain-containing protein [Flammeovirgaceae bacterium SG7u.111]